MSPARLLVRAIVVSDGRTTHLADVLASIAAQTLRPDIVHVALPLDAPRPPTPDGLVIDWRDTARSYTRSIGLILAEHPAHPQEYLWLLHDDTAALPEALAQLVATAKKRTAAAVVAPAHVRWDDPTRLVNLGVTTTRVGARRIDLVEQDDINQGQYDERDDVLAASIAAALVRRDVWDAFGGLEPAYRGYGDSLHFCRRAWRAGHDVVIVPSAKVRHSQDGLRGVRQRSSRGTDATYGLRRTGEWVHALAWSRPLMVPVLLLWTFLSAATRAVLRIAQNESRMVGADLAVPWRVLARLPKVPGMRARIRRGSTRPATAVAPFLVGTRAVISHVRSRELHAYDRWRAQSAPSDMVRFELERAAARRRTGLGIVVVLAIAASVALHGTWLSAIASGRMLAGRALGVTDVPVDALWERTWSGWSTTGFGSPALDGSFSALLLPLAALPGGLRVWIGVLLGMGVALATASAWFALGAATRSVWARGLGAFAYGLWPLHLQAIADGRVGPVIAHVMLPWFAMGLARAAGWHRGEAVGGGEEFPARRLPSPSAAMGAAFSLAVVVVAAPVLLLPLVLVVLVAGAFAGTARWRVWSAAVPALVVSGPALVAAWTAGPLTADAWAILARENGPALVSEAVEPWRIVLGLTAEPLGTPGLPGLPGTVVVGAIGLAVVLAAAVAVGSGRAPWAVAGGMLVAALGVVTAAAAQSTVVVTGAVTGEAPANGFAGPGSTLVVAGLLGAAAAASSRLWTRGEGRGRAAVRTSTSVAAVLMAGVIVATVVVEAWPGREERGDVHPVEATVLPLVAALEQELSTRQRVLVLTDTDEGVDYTVLESDGTVVLDGRAQPAVDALVTVPQGATAATLADTVATLAGAGADATPLLADWGVGVIVAAPGSTMIASSLSQLPELDLIGASEVGTSYRVSRAGSDVPVSRAWVDRGGDIVPADADSWSGAIARTAGGDGTLVIAAPADERWIAESGGVALASVDDALGRAAFSVPAGAGEVTYRYEDHDHRLWWWAALVTVAWAVVGMIPLHDRRFQAVRR
ncbi:glycosyltransferase [Demequina mangrovi]|uniref:Glycosyltransferase, GT2 family n=1 Tax=Demequina mangrovi TaxID=1043493 RepID=A0A1H6X1U7_9MICO|nr:glycosyltransferase [Demequina mangrovi]SEJ20587.1 Glycosyltransferase, GT2 family [Demequina mangrovi]